MNKPLNKCFNVATNQIANSIFPNGFDVGESAPQSYDDLQAHYKKTGRVLVWNGGSDQTIFGDCESNFAFRAWHDSKHILGKLPFTYKGELRAMLAMFKDIRALYGNGEIADKFCRIVNAEIQGQFLYKESRGGFPVDQRGFVAAYLIDSVAALAGDFGISAV